MKVRKSLRAYYVYIYTRWEMVTWRDSLEHRTHTASRRHVWEMDDIFCFSFFSKI